MCFPKYTTSVSVNVHNQSLYRHIWLGIKIVLLQNKVDMVCETFQTSIHLDRLLLEVDLKHFAYVGGLIQNEGKGVGGCVCVQRWSSSSQSFLKKRFIVDKYTHLVTLGILLYSIEKVALTDRNWGLWSLELNRSSLWLIWDYKTKKFQCWNWNNYSHVMYQML